MAVARKHLSTVYSESAAACIHLTVLKRFRVNRDAPLSVYLSGGQYFSKTPLVLRAQPHLTVQSPDSIVTMPWAGPIDIETAR